MPFWTQRPQKPPFEEPPSPEIEQTTRLLGPFRVEHDTPDTDDGIEVADLVSGTFVFDLVVMVVTPWDSDNTVTVVVGVGEDNQDFTVRSGPIDAGSGPFGVTGALSNALTGDQDSILCLSECKLIVQVGLGEASAPTEGAIDIYALIAEF